MQYHKLGDTFYHVFSTRNASNVATAPTGSVSVKVWKRASGSWSLVATTTATQIDGNKYESFYAITTGNGFADGNVFFLELAATVDGVQYYENVSPTFEVGCATPDLDDVSTTAPSTVASTFRQMIVQSWMRWYRPSKLDRNNETLETFAPDGTTVVTTQSATYDEANDVETVGNAE
jgi:hypothetical protein